MSSHGTKNLGEYILAEVEYILAEGHLLLYSGQNDGKVLG